jgi:hypothetical protein
MISTRLAALAAALLALSPLGCQSDSLTPPPEVPAPWPPDVPAIGRSLGAGAAAEAAPVIGQGLDSVAEELRETCFVPSAITSVASGYGALGPVGAWEAIGRMGLADLQFPTAAFLETSTRAAAGRLLADDGYAIDSWTMFEVGFDAQVIDGGAGRWLVDPASAEFPARCGDGLVRGVVPGGQVLYGWRLETGTLVGRHDLLSEFGYPPSWAGSSATAAEIRRKLAAWKGRAVVRVLALQRGGDPTLLSASVGDGTTSSAWTLDCAADDLGPCGAFFQRAAGAMMRDVPGSFVSTVQAAPVVISDIRTDWAVFGGPDLRWLPPDDVRSSRLRLTFELSVQAAVQARLSILETGLLDLAPAVAAKLPAWRATADANLALVADALHDCGERLTDWTDAAQVARCAAGGTHAALVGRGLDETLTAAAMEAVPTAP